MRAAKKGRERDAGETSGAATPKKPKAFCIDWQMRGECKKQESCPHKDTHKCLNCGSVEHTWGNCTQRS